MSDRGAVSFGGFTLDVPGRELRRGDARVDLPPRYFDALALLVRERGRLVTKERLLDDVWRGVPVTDEAITQCVKTLRQRLGDSAASPRFIETAPKHGYRFIAEVEAGEAAAAAPEAAFDWRGMLVTWGAAVVGGGCAGVAGGFIYGLGGAREPLAAGMGAASVLLVLMCLNIAAGLLGGIGVGLGIAAAGGRRWWSVAGGAIGGGAIGAAAQLLGLDAFSLLVGRAPAGITGGLEGTALGGAVALGAQLGGGFAGPTAARPAVGAGIAGAVAGALIAALGGRLMGGSLDLLARSFPESRLNLDAFGRLFGEPEFGPATQAATAAIEGALFAVGVAAAIALAHQHANLGQKR